MNLANNLYGLRSRFIPRICRKEHNFDDTWIFPMWDSKQMTQLIHALEFWPRILWNIIHRCCFKKLNLWQLVNLLISVSIFFLLLLRSKCWNVVKLPGFLEINIKYVKIFYFKNDLWELCANMSTAEINLATQWTKLSTCFLQSVLTKFKMI